MSDTASYRLDGLEPDNLLAFLALLGLLRALEASDEARTESRLNPRAGWDVDAPPLRPRLFLARACALDELLNRTADGIDTLASFYDFDAREDLDFPRQDCRSLLEQEARSSLYDARYRVDLLAALMSDACIKEDKGVVDPTPLCLLFGQGHQHFLERLAAVPRETAPPPRGKGKKKAAAILAVDCLNEALFQPWHRSDPTDSFRWDPEEDVRYALMAGDPTDPAYKVRTQHGANRLATLGLATLTLVPTTRSGVRVRPTIIGDTSSRHGFSFAWPVWREPATLAAIRALLAHGDLRTPGALAHLGVVEVLVARRISSGKFMNFTRARPLQDGDEAEDGPASTASRGTSRMVPPAGSD